ncbi:MAG: bifunctional oligoribonuclease/PAP phosphatase NrnA [Epsilonproteobacteria bacterium]|nr:bifunctional oligoribonuclease/PAP phosphatase NrnA [Campylobacterota bacterium]
MKEKIIKLIKNANKIVIASHINPDADTIGSMLGLGDGIKKIAKKVTYYNPSKELPRRFDFFCGFTKIKDKLPDNFDLLICVDCASLDRTTIKNGDFKIINFDHHKTNNNFGDINIVKENYASCSMVIFEFLNDSQLDISPSCATSLYAALVEDSGFFKYERVDKTTFYIAQKLIEYGAKPDKIASLLTQREPLAKYRLLQRYLNNIELKANATVCISRLDLEDYESTGASVSDSDSFVQMGLSLATVKLSIFIYQLDENRAKISLRSKNDIDCSVIALSYGGGGHKRAAGFTANLKDIDDIIVNILKKVNI